MKKDLIIPYLEKVDFDSKHFSEDSVHIDIDCVNWPDKFPDRRQTTAFLAHDGQNIYIKFKCLDRDIMAVTDTNLGPVANDSCVEFFVSPDATSSRYWNFEFNAIGYINASTRSLRPEPRRLSSDELSLIKTFPSEGRNPFSERRGKFIWEINIIIPLEIMGIKYVGLPVEMRGNFYKCAGKTSSPHYLSWAPIDTEKPDFHRPEFFRTIILSGKN